MNPTQQAVSAAYALSSPCTICPRNCRVDRQAGETGYCGVGALPIVASAGPHFGEEPPLVGHGGSGTIFFSGCNLLCCFCQNYDISHGLSGRESGPDAIADMMHQLERLGCHNINFVTPSHVAPWLMDAVRRARLAGLAIPIVWNCGGYESLDVLRLLDGTVDIYMPDAKFMDPELSARYMNARDYPERMKAALIEMQRQVGVLETENGVATRGLLVRHLVMPGCVEDSKRILRFIAKEVSPDTWVNVMPQYRPLFKAAEHEDIARPPTTEEFAEVRDFARDLGLNLF